MRSYPIGQEVTIGATFHMQGALRDPGSNADDQTLLVHHQRSGYEIDLSPVMISQGVWEAYITPPYAGEWRYNWTVVAPFETAQNGKFYVESIIPTSLGNAPTNGNGSGSGTVGPPGPAGPAGPQGPPGQDGAGSVGFYSSATHPGGMSISVPQSEHGLNASRALLVQALDETTGFMVVPDLHIETNGDVLLMFTSAVPDNSVRVTIVGEVV